MSFVKNISKVPENWDGEIKRQDPKYYKKSFSFALTGENYCTILNKKDENIDFFCFKCKAPTQVQLFTKKPVQGRLRSVPNPALPAQVSSQRLVARIQLLTKKSLSRDLENLTKSKSLKIDQCCKVFSSEKNTIGDEFITFAWTDTARNASISKGADFKSLVDLSCESLENENPPFKFKKCECGELLIVGRGAKYSEPCSTTTGTSSFNSLGKLTNRLPRGINHVGVDVTESTYDFVGLALFGHAYIAKIRELGKNEFFLTLTVPVRDKADNWEHTVVAQVLLGPRSAKAVIIDPNEAFLHHKKRRGMWLSDKMPDRANADSDAETTDEDDPDVAPTPKKKKKDKTTKRKINDFFLYTFGISTVNYGSNGNGLANPRELFSQYKNSCNVTVTVNLFFIAVGYDEIPRFSKNIERAIFCRLRRVLKNNEVLPKFFNSPVKNRSELQTLIENFIRT